jgi:hypothetical protein
MFPGKARSPPYSETPEWCFTWIGCSLTHKQKTTLEKSARDKLSSFLGTTINY